MASWLAVVSRAHVERGVAGGFAQVCHGRSGPLRRMRGGDRLVTYSPATEMRGGERLQAFTALGQLRDDCVYPHDRGDGWVPFRRDVRYEPVSPVPIATLADRLHLTARPSWGIALRRGLLPLDEHDFELIAAALRGTAPARGRRARGRAPGGATGLECLALFALLGAQQPVPVFTGRLHTRTPRPRQPTLAFGDR